MSGMFHSLLPLALLAAQPAATRSPFNGTWLIDLGSIEQAPEITDFSLAKGVFSRAVNGPEFAVKADGRIHAIAGDNYVDAVAVTVLGPRRVREMDRLRGRMVYSVAYDVSADGRTMTARVVDFGKPDHKPVVTVVTRVRIGGRRRRFAAERPVAGDGRDDHTQPAHGPVPAGRQPLQ